MSATATTDLREELPELVVRALARHLDEAADPEAEAEDILQRLVQLATVEAEPVEAHAVRSALHLDDLAANLAELCRSPRFILPLVAGLASLYAGAVTHSNDPIPLEVQITPTDRAIFGWELSRVSSPAGIDPYLPYLYIAAATFALLRSDTDLRAAFAACRQLLQA